MNNIERADMTFTNRNEKSLHFSYCNPFILLCIQLFLNASVSYRACSKICGVLSSYLDIHVPHFTTIRQWVLRFAYYNLHKPMPIRDDWVYIVDYTIAASKNKVLAILGVTLEQLGKTGYSPKLSDVELLHLSVTPKATWDVTYNALIKTSKLTGIPAEIISYHGADIKRGTKEFCEEMLQQKNTMVHYIYDITHMIACILKSMLSSQPNWGKFIKRAMRCKQQTKQSALSFLGPPSQRSKARFLNIAQIVKWGSKLLRYKEKGNFIDISKTIAEKNENRHNINPEDSCMPPINESIKLFNTKFKWLNVFKGDISIYEQYIDIIKEVKREIASFGLHSKTLVKLENKLIVLSLSETAIEFKNKIIEGVKANMPPQGQDVAYLGCSDIIESLFGKYKNHCSENSMLGITQSVLIMAAATSTLNIDTVKEAMKFSIYNDIQIRSKIVIGESDFSRRKKAFIGT